MWGLVASPTREVTSYSAWAYGRVLVSGILLTSSEISPCASEVHLWAAVVGQWYSTCGSRRGVRGADAFYFSMTTTLRFGSVLSTSLSPWGFIAIPAIVPPCEAFGEVRCLALGKRFPRLCFNYDDVKSPSVLGKRRKLHGAKSSRYRGFGTTAPLFLAKSLRMDKV
jgi:hypothetical protein